MASQYGLLLDLNRCTGCKACIIACKQENNLPPRLDAIPGSQGFSYISVECIGPEGEYPDLSMYYLPTMCMHCKKPPCIEACPVEALYKRKDGIVLIDSSVCTGCEACVAACPYDAVSMDSEQEVAGKCTLCAHRIDRDEPPACVASCNAGAMLFGDTADTKSEISRVISEGKDNRFVLKPDAETGPSVHYLKFRVEAD